MMIPNRFTRSRRGLPSCSVDRAIFSIKLVILGLAPFGVVAARPPDAFGGCAPGCKICLLDVCSDAPQSRPGEQKSGSGQQQPPGPTSDDPAVNLDNKLKGVKPGDTSDPVIEWSGFSGRDLYFTFFNAFVMAGNCMDLYHTNQELDQLSTGVRRTTEANPDEWKGRWQEEEQQRYARAEAAAARYGETARGLTVRQQYDLLSDDAMAREWAENHKDPWRDLVKGQWITIGQQIKIWRTENVKYENELKKDLQDLQAKIGKHDCGKWKWN